MAELSTEPSTEHSTYQVCFQNISLVELYSFIYILIWNFEYLCIYVVFISIRLQVY